MNDSESILVPSVTTLRKYLKVMVTTGDHQSLDRLIPRLQPDHRAAQPRLAERMEAVIGGLVRTPPRFATVLP